jgi:hypothetical protein
VLLAITKSGIATSRITTAHTNDAVIADGNNVKLIVGNVVLTAQA